MTARGTSTPKYELPEKEFVSKACRSGNHKVCYVLKCQCPCRHGVIDKKCQK